MTLVRPAPSAPFKRHLSTMKPAMPSAMRCPLQIIGCSALAAGTEGGSAEFVFDRSQFDVDDEGPNRCCTSILHQFVQLRYLAAGSILAACTNAVRLDPHPANEASKCGATRGH